MKEDIPTDRTGSMADGGLSESVPLRDFLSGLGPLLRLAPRDGQSAAAAPPREKEPRRNRAAPVLAAVLVLTVLAAGARLIAGSSANVLPPEVLGSWQTDDPRYVGREFHLGPATLTLQTGPDIADVMRYPIREIEARALADTTEYRITYNNDGVEAEFGFRHVRTTDEIVFEHQRELHWHRLRPPGPS